MTEMIPYFNTACGVCLRASEDIHRCAACKTVAYCTKEHQTQDWANHRQLCKVIRNCELKFKGGSYAEFLTFKVALKAAWQYLLQRELQISEEMMTLYPRVCVVCFERVYLYDCKKCLCVSYCSKEHEDKYSYIHKEYCKELKLGLLYHQFILRYNVSIEFKPVDTKKLQCTADVVKHFVREFKHRTVSNEDNCLTDEDCISGSLIQSSQFIFIGLNILYALMSTNFQGTNLDIHIVGASTIELLTQFDVVSDIIKHWLPINFINYYLVGPEVTGNSFHVIDSTSKISYYRNFYHEVVDNITKPHFVFAFNSGLHEFSLQKFDPWKLSIPSLIKYEDVPLVLTSYVQPELWQDKKILLGLKNELTILLDISRNPFASLLPLRNWESVTEPVYYMCNYILIVKKEKSSSTT